MESAIFCLWDGRSVNGVAGHCPDGRGELWLGPACRAQPQRGGCCGRDAWSRQDRRDRRAQMARRKALCVRASSPFDSTHFGLCKGKARSAFRSLDSAPWRRLNM